MERDVSFLFFTEKKNVQYVKTDPTCVQEMRAGLMVWVPRGLGLRPTDSERRAVGILACMGSGSS
jgi:hypothetical protein